MSEAGVVRSVLYFLSTTLLTLPPSELNVTAIRSFSTVISLFSPPTYLAKLLYFCTSPMAARRDATASPAISGVSPSRELDTTLFMSTSCPLAFTWPVRPPSGLTLSAIREFVYDTVPSAPAVPYSFTIGTIWEASAAVIVSTTAAACCPEAAALASSRSICSWRSLCCLAISSSDGLFRYMKPNITAPIISSPRRVFLSIWNVYCSL